MTSVFSFLFTQHQALQFPLFLKTFAPSFTRFQLSNLKRYILVTSILHVDDFFFFLTYSLGLDGYGLSISLKCAIFFFRKCCSLGQQAMINHLSQVCKKAFFFFLFLFFSKNANLDIVGYGLSIYLSCALQTQNPKFENQIIENTSQI